MGRLVPWCTWEEWDEVASCLLSGDSRLIGRGISRVSTWRCRGRVPLGADATAALLEISQQDACWYHGDAAGIVSEHSLRLAYSMALVRFVNGVVDSGQKGQAASSVATLARTYGLPRMLVDIRHEATHNSLPSLGTLRLASTHALQWLHINYWNKQQAFRAESVERLDALVQQLLELHADEGKADEAEGGSGTSTAREVKQQLKMAVAELKDIVPSGDTVLLVEPLLKRLPDGSRPPPAKGSNKKRPRSVAWFEQGGDPPSWLAAVQMLAKDWDNLPALLLERLLRHSCEAFCAKDWAEVVKRTQLCSQLLEALVHCSADAPTRASEILAEALLAALLTAMRGAVPADRTSSPSGGGGSKKVKLPLTLSLEVDEAAARSLAGDGAQCRAVERFEELAKGITTLISTEPRRKSAQKLLGLTMELFSDDIDTEDLPSGSPSLIAEAESAQQALMESIRKRKASSIKAGGMHPKGATGVWAKHDSWSPCAVGCVPSTASQNGAPPTFLTQPEHDEFAAAEAGQEDDVAVTVHHNYYEEACAEDPAEGGDAYDTDQVKNLALPFLIDAASSAAAAAAPHGEPPAAALEDIQASIGLL